MTKALQQKPILLGITFIGFSLLGYPAKAEQACVRTTSGQRVCGELLPKERESTVQKLEANEFMFELQGCRRSGDTVRCNLLITNVGDSDRKFWLSSTYNPASRVIAASGEEFKSTGAQLGQQRGSSYADLQMIRGVPIRAALSFEGTPSRISSLAVLEVGYGFYNPYGVGKTIQFRNVAIQSR